MVKFIVGFFDIKIKKRGFHELEEGIDVVEIEIEGYLGEFSV